MGFLTVLHLGHLGEVAGHDHWIGLAAAGIAIGALVIGVLAGRKEDDDQVEEDEATEEEAAA